MFNKNGGGIFWRIILNVQIGSVHLKHICVFSSIFDMPSQRVLLDTTVLVINRFFGLDEIDVEINEK